MYLCWSYGRTGDPPECEAVLGVLTNGSGVFFISWSILNGDIPGTILPSGVVFKQILVGTFFQWSNELLI